MKQQDSNTFGGGLNTDMNYLSLPKDVYVDALNATLTTHNGNEFIMQTDKGNTYSSSISEGFVAIGVISDGNVAYILSHNPTTLAGEIGSYPAPDYTTTSIDEDGTVVGDLIMEYRPFRNYTANQDRLPEFVREFTSASFNFDLEHPCDMEIQKDYDGTSNIIFTDDKNPIRIINSYFRVESNNRFRIIDRVGNNDTNIYNEESFSSTINLIIRSATIPKLTYLGQDSGSGQVTCGDYTYYFRYVDIDGNISDIIEQSGKVSVFIGEDPQEIRGGKPNERSNKTVKFKLENLDPAFSFINVTFTYKASLSGVDPVIRGFTLDTNFPINNGFVDIRHTGFETVQEIDTNTLNLDFSPIKTAKTLAQVQGRLMVGNVVIQDLDDEEFREFASKIRIISTPITGQGTTDQKAIGYTGLQPVSNIFGLTRSGEGRNLGYWSDFNIYDRLGYFDAEVYQFGIVFITLEGFTTPVYPLEGTVGNDYSGTADESNDFFDPVTGLNKKGIFFFRGKDTQSKKGPGNVFARGVRFNFGNLTSDELQSIKTKTKGYFFVRTEREPLTLGEGVVVPTINHTNVAWDDLTEDARFENANGNFVYPVVHGHIENNFTATGDDTLRASPRRFIINNSRLNYNVGKLGAFIPDLEAKPNQLVDTLDNRDVFMLFDGMNTGVRGDVFNLGSTEQQQAVTNNENSNISDISVLVKTPTSYSHGGYNSNTNDFRTDIISPVSTIFVSRQDKASNQTFQSYCSGIIDGAVVFDTVRFQLRSENYIGVNNEKVDSVGDNLIQPIIDFVSTISGGSLNPNSPIVLPTDLADIEDITNQQGLGNAMSYRVRFYNSEDPFNISSLRDRYLNISGNTYFPITSRITWEDAESENFIINGQLCFGGDCYKQITHKRVQWSTPNELLPSETNLDPDPGVSQGITFSVTDGFPRPTSVWLQIFSSNSNNVHLLDEDLVDANESAIFGRDRFIFPFSLRTSTSGTLFSSTPNLIKMISTRRGEFKITPSTEYNAGYSSSPSDKVYFGLTGAPFIGIRYDTRIYYSNIHVNNQFVNGLRIFQGANYQDYPRKSGEITKLENVNNSLIMIQETGIAQVGVNDRTIVGGDSSGSVFVDQAGVLHPKAGYYSESYGSRWFNSITESTNTVYGIDVASSKIWMLTPDKGINLISDYKVESFLRSVLQGYRGLSTVIGTTDIVTLYDPFKRDMIFTGYGKDPFTLIYNEDTQKWITKSSMNPYQGWNISGNFISMGVDENTKIWKHAVDSPYCNFYGTQGQFIVEFIVKNNITVQKIFDNLKIISNNELPIQIQYINDNDNVIVDSIPRTNKNIFSHNISYKENHVYVQVNSKKSSRVRDKYCNIRLIYTGEDLAFIQAVITLFRYSYS